MEVGNTRCYSSKMTSSEFPHDLESEHRRTGKTEGLGQTTQHLERFLRIRLSNKEHRYPLFGTSNSGAMSLHH